MASERIMDEFTEFVVDEDGHRLRDWLLNDENSAGVLNFDDPQNYGKPIIETGCSIGPNPICPVEISNRNEFHT